MLPGRSCRRSADRLDDRPDRCVACPTPPSRATQPAPQGRPHPCRCRVPATTWRRALQVAPFEFVLDLESALPGANRGEPSPAPRPPQHPDRSVRRRRRGQAVATEPSNSPDAFSIASSLRRVASRSDKRRALRTQVSSGSSISSRSRDASTARSNGGRWARPPEMHRGRARCAGRGWPCPRSATTSICSSLRAPASATVTGRGDHRAVDPDLVPPRIGDLVERALGRRQGDPLRRLLGEFLEPLERERGERRAWCRPSWISSMITASTFARSHGLAR